MEKKKPCKSYIGYVANMGFTGGSGRGTWVQSIGSERSHGEGNGNPSSIHAWEIPWTKEPGGLQSIGAQKSQTQLSDKVTTTTQNI